MKFAELSDRVKEKIRSQHREWACLDEWYECIIEDADTIAKILGIYIDRRGSKRPNILWEVDTQYSGAAFTGEYRLAQAATDKIVEYAPEDKELARIANELTSLQVAAVMQYRSSLMASIVLDSWPRDYSMQVTVSLADDDVDAWSLHADDEIKLTKLLVDFAHWIYKRLQAEHDYRMSDEAVDEDIMCNDYDFDEDGVTV